MPARHLFGGKGPEWYTGSRSDRSSCVFVQFLLAKSPKAMRRDALNPELLNPEP